MIERLGYKRLPLYPASISQYEAGTREPPLPVLLKYARLAGVPVEALIDDALDMPEHLPGTPEHEWIMTRVRTKKRR
jgi:transcriptional regulator with XRE-family HTH domain